MTTALTLYFTNTVGSTLATTYQLSITHGTDNTNVTQNYTQFGTSTGYGELYAPGTTNAWGAGGSIGSPSGNGFMLEASVLNLAGYTLAAGSWTANTRLSVGHSDGTLGGTVTGNIYLRAYKYNSGTYTQIIAMSLTGQTIPTTSGSLVTYALSGSTGASTAFVSGDLVYVDQWIDITANGLGDAAKCFRVNRISTNNTGDSNFEMVTPGYSPTVSSTKHFFGGGYDGLFS
jgi:hypothetical protein